MSPSSIYHGNISACIHVSGSDALRYLRSQLTVSIPDPDQQRWAYGLWLNESGRVLADSYVYAQAEDSCLVWSYFCPSKLLLSTLQRNLVADQVETTDLSSDFQFTLLHRDPAMSTSLMDRLPHLNMIPPSFKQVTAGDDYFALGGSPLGSEDLIFIGETAFHEKLHAVWAQALPDINFHPISGNAFEFMRISNAVSAIPRDLNHRNLPLEGRFSESVVDYQKGCFPGQEIMAKFRKGGKLNKQIQIFELLNYEGNPSNTISLPTSIRSGKSESGTLTSLASLHGKTVAMGILRQRSIDKPLHIQDEAGQEYRLRLMRTTDHSTD